MYLKKVYIKNVTMVQFVKTVDARVHNLCIPFVALSHSFTLLLDLFFRGSL